MLKATAGGGMGRAPFLETGRDIFAGARREMNGYGKKQKIIVRCFDAAWSC